MVSRYLFLLLVLLPACVLTACTLAFDTSFLNEDCPPGEKPCDGVCVSKKSELYGCGEETCDFCFAPNANMGCSADDRCEIRECVAPFADCDVTEKGCETNLDYSDVNCGGCASRGEGTDCSKVAVLNGRAGCAEGRCIIKLCDAGYAACEVGSAGQPLACETNVLEDRNNCGQCGTACPPGADCRNGSCE
jgi:hypothetical protein